MSIFEYDEEKHLKSERNLETGWYCRRKAGWYNRRRISFNKIITAYDAGQSERKCGKSACRFRIS